MRVTVYAECPVYQSGPFLDVDETKLLRNGRAQRVDTDSLICYRQAHGLRGTCNRELRLTNLRMFQHILERFLCDAVRKMGVDRVVQPEFEGDIEMVRQALVAWEFDRNEAWRLTKTLRAILCGTKTSANKDRRF